MALHLKSTGIDFTDFTDATESSELLDDYEEGSWTPISNFGGTSILNSQEGFYTKIGRSCECRFYIKVVNTTPPAGDGSNTPTAGDFAGLPFTTSNEITNDGNGAGGGMCTYSNGFGTVDTSIMVNSNTTSWKFYAGYQQNQLPDNKNAKGTMLYAVG